MQCPFCKEVILDEAIKCKHCQSMLDGSSTQAVVIKGVDPFAQYHTPIQGKKKGKLTAIGMIGIFVIVPIMLLSAVLNAKEGNGLIAVYCLGFALSIGVGGYLWARK